MNYFTQVGLDLLQKAKLDNITIKAFNNRVCNSLLLKCCWQKRGYVSYYKQYQEWKEKLEKNSITFKDKKVLEIGAGSSIGIGYFFLADNFKFWLGTDLNHNLKTDRRLIKREFRFIKEIFKNFNSNIFDEVKIKKDSISFGQRFDFKQLQIADLVENSIERFNIIISSAVLEHITAGLVEKTIVDLKNCLKTGGLMIHEIDLRDHINVANPFNFYRYSEASWEKLTGKTIFYCNRLRLADYLKIFNKLNFKIKFLEVQTKLLPEKIKINEVFKKYSKEELEVIRVFIILEKP